MTKHLVGEKWVWKKGVSFFGQMARLLLKRLSKMNKVKAHQLRTYEDAKLVEELTTHRVS